VSKSLLAFHYNYVCILYRFRDIQRHIMCVTLKSELAVVQGR